MGLIQENEYEILHESLRSTQTTRSSIAIFFGTVNLAGMAFAIEGKAPVVAVFAGIFLWLFVFVEILIRGYLVAIYYRLYQLGEVLGITPHNEYLQVTYPRKITDEQFKNISVMEDKEKRVKALDNLRWEDDLWENFKSQPFFGFYLPIILSVLEILFGIYAQNYGFDSVIISTN